jgi:hypothetical protein
MCVEGAALIHLVEYTAGLIGTMGIQLATVPNRRSTLT